MTIIKKSKIITAFSAIFLTAAAFAVVPKIPDFADPFDYLRKIFNEPTDALPDFAREVRIVDEIRDVILDGDEVPLALPNGAEVFAISMPSEEEPPKGGIILLHSRGFHANWPYVIQPLRVALAEDGWHTLSVQMPVLGKRAKYYDYVPIFPYAHGRIRAAIDFFKNLGIDNIVVIAHGCGAHMSMSYIDKYGDGEIDAYVGVGMGATDFRQKIIRPFPLDRMRVPVLDIFGEYDYPGVIRLSVPRLAQLNLAANPKSAQRIVAGADHDYRDNDTTDILVDEVGKWLNQLNIQASP